MHYLDWKRQKSPLLRAKGVEGGYLYLQKIHLNNYSKLFRDLSLQFRKEGNNIDNQKEPNVTMMPVLPRG